METKWERRRILIWGKTRPEISQTYREIVCTGGVFEDTRRLVRLYPIPLRYIDDEKKFKKYQWVEAYVTKASSDSRPESYKVRYDDIQTFETIPTDNNWNERAKWVLNPANIYNSVEGLQAQQKIDRTSLGLVKPAEVFKVTAHKFNQEERNEFWEHYKNALRQMDLPLDPESGREIKPLRPPDYRFKINFRCADSDCAGQHSFNILDWETDALYFNLRTRGDTPEVASKKVVDKLQDDICSGDKDLYFFLGNISNHQHIFTIVGIWYPKKKVATVDDTERYEQGSFL